MEGAIAGRRAIAISFPFFSGWNNWTPEQLGAATRVAGSVTEQLWSGWDECCDLFNVNIPVSVAEDDHEVLFTEVDTTAQYQSLYGASSANAMLAANCMQDATCANPQHRCDV